MSFTRISWPRRLSLFAGGVGLLLGLGVLANWVLARPGTEGRLPAAAMAPATALAVGLAGAALLFASGLLDEAQSLKNRGLILACASGAGLIGLFRLAEHLGGRDFGVNRLWLVTAQQVGSARMAPATAMAVLLLGAALLVPRRPKLHGIFQALAMLAGLIGWLGLSRYVYGGEPLIPYGQMAILTALAFLALSAGTLCARPEGGLVGLLAADSAGGQLARRLLPPALLVPLVLGWLRLQGQRAGWYGTEAGISLFALSNVLVFGALVWVNGALLDHSDSARRQAATKLKAQLERLNLLHLITRAIGERQDLRSIFQVVIRSLEDELPVDFGCMCLYDHTARALTVTCVGVKSGTLATQLAMPERARVAIDENGLSRCVAGNLVYEPDIRHVAFPFPRRLAEGGLCSLVAAPLRVESAVFGVLVAARVAPNSFTSGECEFLGQLTGHVALAAHQAQLHGALQQAYDDLRQTQQAVMQQERLRALGQMASGIAHDINNAISPVALYTESLLEKEPGLSARAKEYLETIQHAVDDVGQTVSRMREFYRQREPQLSLAPVDLSRLGQQVKDLSRARWSDMPQQRGLVIELVTELAPGLPPVMGVESEIREALINLVFNAVDAMPEGGTLTLRSRATQPAGAQVQVEVADTGVGMDDETRRRCLEPFFTTKGERGTGLGLAMVYGVAKRHSADLEIESVPGAGTTVRLTFQAAAGVQVQPASYAPQAARSRLRILVVDDDPLLLKSLRDTLEDDGHLVVTANQGQAGIDAFRAATGGKEAFAVVITDLGMPYVDGRQVAAAVKLASPSTPVILLTGWGQRLVAEDDVPEHVDHVISKPPKLRELREALARCAGGPSGPEL
jgi:signal transduction histidine kinase/ActR/RegA family two-component response regulator